MGFMDVVAGNRVFSSAKFNAGIARHGAIGYNMRSQQFVTTQIFFQQYGSGLGSQVIHKRTCIVGLIEEIAVAVTACNQNRIQFLIGKHHILRYFKRGHRCAATLLNI